MIERCCCAGFLFEAAEPVGIPGNPLGEGLYRNPSIEAGIVRTIDAAKSTRTEEAFDLVGAESRT